MWAMAIYQSYFFSFPMKNIYDAQVEQLYIKTYWL